MPLNWQFPNPFVAEFKVSPTDIDRLGHVNNVRYLAWLEEAAWRHADALGMGWTEYERLGCAVVVHRHEIDYLKPALVGDELQVGTWCTGNDGKLRCRRHYQILRPADAATLVRAQTQWISVDLVTGRPRRMPREFVEAYRPVPESPA